MSYTSWIAFLLPAIMVAIVAVDAGLGARAEYLNATAIVEGWWRLVTTGTPGSNHTMFLGADRLSPSARLLAGTSLWVLEAAIVSAVVALPLHRVAS
jgi:hypothetical protein